MGQTFLLRGHKQTITESFPIIFGKSESTFLLIMERGKLERFQWLLWKVIRKDFQLILERKTIKSLAKNIQKH